MSGLYRRIPVEDETTPVMGVVYHPVSVRKLMNGENVDPLFLLVPYEYEGPLQELCEALGWQGGTIYQVIEEVKRLAGTCTNPLQVEAIK